MKEKMIKDKFLWFPVLILLMLSCTAGIYPYLGRPAADPEVVQPVVQSFMQEQAVVIGWQEDICADIFVLYRRQDMEGAATELLYQGTNLEYTDKNGENEARYLYSLAKTRGSRTFGPSDEVLGVFSSTVRDFSEPNNSKEEAAWLETDLDVNSYYYQDRAGNILEDTDWYYITVPARRAAHLVLSQHGLDAGSTFFHFAREGQIPFQAVNGADIVVENYTHNTQQIYFKVYPVPGKFLNDLSQAGGAVVGYKISLDAINNL